MSTLFPVTIGSVTIFGTEIAGCTRHTRLVTERAAVMSLINQVFGPTAMLSHTPHGAPFIADNPTRISISRSRIGYPRHITRHSDRHRRRMLARPVAARDTQISHPRRTNGIRHRPRLAPESVDGKRSRLQSRFHTRTVTYRHTPRPQHHPGSGIHIRHRPHLYPAPHRPIPRHNHSRATKNWLNHHNGSGHAHPFTYLCRKSHHHDARH